MIAMQYRFVLPADYDMAIIDRRIAEKGGSTDGFPKLAFKAYLSARRGEDGPENLYAPFYLWATPDGLSNFLCGAGFEALTQSFGWPQVKTWVVWRAEAGADIAEAKFATREILPTPPYSPMGELRRRALDETSQDASLGALASIAGFEPTTWTRMRFQLWRDKPDSASRGAQMYRVGHISTSQTL